MKQQQGKSKQEKAWYKAIDFPELKTLMTKEQADAYRKLQESGGSGNSSSDGSNSSSGEKENTHPNPERIAELAKIARDVLTKAKGMGKDTKVTCPLCSGDRCFINRKTGVFHCWTCSGAGRLKELIYEQKAGQDSGSADPNYYVKARNRKGKKNDEVPMLPSDYKPISLRVRTCLYPIYPFDSEEKQKEFYEKFHPANARSLDRKAKGTLTAEQLKSLQAQVQRYCQAMGFSTEVLKRERVMCAQIYRKTDDAQSEDPKGCELVPAIAYCNRIYGEIVNVKFRSVLQNPITGEWSKDFIQESPTTPLAPYGIDSICPERPDAGDISQLVFTEGEKDRLTLLSCGIPYALSIPSGADSNIEENNEAFESWIDEADEIIICGDSDRPGRKLVKRLLDHYAVKARLAQLPPSCKDISEVYQRFGAEEVRRIIAEAKRVGNEEVYDTELHKQDIVEVMLGHYDHGYEIGMGPLTDHIFHPTSDGGLIILTGIPNSGKTDFLNCMMTHLMCHCHKKIAFFSFELTDKRKHYRNIARIALGEANLEQYGNTPDSRQNEAYIKGTLSHTVDYLNNHMFDFVLKEQTLPTPATIIHAAEKQRKSKGLHYLVIDPYIFVNVSEGHERSTETEQVKVMLTSIQNWSRMHGIWTVIVAHPRIQRKDGTQADYSDLSLYDIAGSAQWANLADYLFTVKRVNKPEEHKLYTVVNMLKVRDQEFCQTGKVYYVRQPCGRYDERASEEECIAEQAGKILQKDEESWIEMT